MIAIEKRIVPVSANEVRIVLAEGGSQFRMIGVGIQGPPGIPGGPSYTHNQPSPAATWTINHNLGFYPHIVVLSPGLVEVDANVVHISPNQAIIQFSTPFAGLARCI